MIRGGEAMNKQLESRISSREVAEMMEVQHKHLLSKIDGINQDLLSQEIGSAKYWVEDSYKDASGKSNREFQISKRGCEFLAHKTTGTKGNLFTDRYMDKFNEMEQAMKELKQITSENKQPQKAKLIRIGEVGSLIKIVDSIAVAKKLSAQKRAEILTELAEQFGIVIPKKLVEMSIENFNTNKSIKKVSGDAFKDLRNFFN